MTMFLGHFLNEPMRILAKNGSWLVLALNIFTCEWFCFSHFKNNLLYTSVVYDDRNGLLDLLFL